MKVSCGGAIYLHDGDCLTPSSPYHPYACNTLVGLEDLHYAYIQCMCIYSISTVYTPMRLGYIHEVPELARGPF